MLISVLREGATQKRMRRLTQLIHVDRRTVDRWRTWWRDAFTAMPFWQVARASFMPPVAEHRLPTAMLERFSGNSLTERTPSAAGKRRLCNGYRGSTGRPQKTPTASSPHAL